MILGAEIAMIVMGLYALITGKLNMGGKKAKFEVRGAPARLIGAICLMPIPLAILGCFAVAALLVAQGKKVTPESFYWTGVGIEAGVIIACGIVITIIRRAYRVPVKTPETGSPA